MTAVRWGIVSTANINRRVLPEVQPLAEVELLAVASRSQDAAEAFASENGIPRAHGSYEELLADPDVEAIYNPLPNGLHVEWTVRALEAGKHVLCEKPLDRRPEQVERAFDAAERAGLILMEAFMWRHHPQTARAVELVADGAIGELRAVRASFGFTLAGTDDVRAQPHLDGGSLMDVGCYCISGARRFAGEPEVAIGRQLLGRSGVDVRFAGLLVFAGPVFAHFDCGFDVPPDSGVEVVGSAGTLRIRTPFLITEPGIELDRDGGVERVDVEDAGSYERQFLNMSAAIRGDAQPLLGREDALGQARTIDALYRSADRDGEPVALTTP
jgi:D-xylose 1-dehydrogenase (NADP+, D-xylono-1,5-lactone-forming)